MNRPSSPAIRGPLAAIPGLLAAALLAGPLDAQERGPAIRGLLGKVEFVVRGAVLDQEKAPGGLWHRLRVDEVLFESGNGGPLGATVRLFAHGPGVPEGAELTVGDEVIVGATRIAGEPERLDAFRARLLASFRPDRPGERPAIVAPDGIVSVQTHPAAGEAAARMVRVLRDPESAPHARRDLLLELAAHPAAEVREAAVRGMAAPGLTLDADASARVAARFREEAQGPAAPTVLAAHIELAGSLPDEPAAAALALVVRTVPREDIAERAGALLASRGRAGELRDLASGFDAEHPVVQSRIIRTLSRAALTAGVPVYSRGLRSPYAPVREAAAAALERDPSPDATRALGRASRDADDPDVRQAAAAAMDRRAAAFREAAPGAAADDPGGLSALLRLARKRLAGER